MGIAGHQPPGKNILFLVDTSGSMDGRKVQDAIQTTIRIAEAPLDDLQIAIVNFGSNIYRWPGTVDKNPQNGEIISRKRWSLMPSRDNLRIAHAWMQQNMDGGGTNVVAAIKHAFESCSGGKGNETVDDLSIIIISDGIFHTYPRLKATIQEAQRERRRKNLDEAAIGFFGIDDEGNKDQIKSLVGEKKKQGERTVWVVKRCILGYFRLVYPEPEEEEKQKKAAKPKAKTKTKPAPKSKGKPAKTNKKPSKTKKP